MREDAPSTPPAVTVLLLGEPAGDIRVIKTVRSLGEAGYRVTIVCLPPDPSTGGPDQVGGARVVRCTASRPLRRLARLASLRARWKQAPAAHSQPRSQPIGVARMSRPGDETPTFTPRWLICAARCARAVGRAFRPLVIWRRGGLKPTARRGHEAPRPKGRGFKRAYPNEPQAGEEVSTNSTPAGWRRLVREGRALAGTLWLNLALARAASRIPADLIHANDLDTLWAGVLAARAVGAGLIYDAHELYPEMLGSSSPLYSGLWRLIEHRLIRHARAVITVNQAIAEELRNRHRLPRLPSVVMNCPPLVSAGPVSSQSNSDSIGLVYHGALLPERGLETLIEAIPSIDPRVVLHIRGSGPLRPWLEEAAANPELCGRIQIHEPVPPEALAATMVGMEIGIVPYLPTSLNNYLCSPNKLFDYFMGGLAVVASDLPELRRAVRESGAGLVYRAADPQALAEAVNALAAEGAGLQERGRAARAAAEHHYTWAAQERALLAAYRAAASPI